MMETQLHTKPVIPAGALDIDSYNDDCRSYDEIPAVIVGARELAQGELAAAAAPVRLLDVVARDARDGCGHFT
jgi:hypothetical protein